ncbi:response regulator transcription factor [Endozoicomonas sp. G2_1]|uniref:response regulator transcription factor n=1 Tax=Endozoicomonas sp. G2_1 TaxID=2821091 RepID=UPI001AD9672C|nr:response regulator transcription factor [Endozoicomonas sp. G2_1]MBO9491338.1 response regulator transcription factor [Endozoicomonas sp. G2_1]
MVDKVLVVEDEQDISELIAINLIELGLKVEKVATGELAVDLVKKNSYGLVILDVMLPGISGLDVCRKVRELKPEQAIMMLTSRDSETDRVVGLELGADDYMTKPFSVRELQARVRSLLRRVNMFSELQQQCKNDNVEHYINIGNLSIDNISHRITMAGQALDLTSTEYDLLHYLASHPDQVFSRAQLLSSVWGYHHSGYEHTVNSHINRLRNKLERDATKPEIVQTVWGVGYKFNPQGVAA